MDEMPMSHVKKLRKRKKVLERRHKKITIKLQKKHE